jgi:hypothetical protein
LANPVAIESLLLDFKTGAAKKVRVKLLDRKTDGFCGRRESPVADWTSIEFPAH